MKLRYKILSLLSSIILLSNFSVCKAAPKNKPVFPTGVNELIMKDFIFYVDMCQKRSLLDSNQLLSQKALCFEEISEKISDIYESGETNTALQLFQWAACTMNEKVPSKMCFSFKDLTNGINTKNNFEEIIEYIENKIKGNETQSQFMIFALNCNNSIDIFQPYMPYRSIIFMVKNGDNYNYWSLFGPLAIEKNGDSKIIKTCQEFFKDKEKLKNNYKRYIYSFYKLITLWEEETLTIKVIADG